MLYETRRRFAAYYTAADVSGYICRNTIVPALLDAAAARCPTAFGKATPPWSLLQAQGERYIFAATRHGTAQPLPAQVAAGIDTASARQCWNDAAPPSHGLPAETWREALGRRAHAHALRERLAAGEVQASDEVVSLNLDGLLLLHDTIAAADPPLLAAIWAALRELTLLDPTCGEGAFLLAALDLLQPLHLACLARMDALAELEGSHFTDICRAFDAAPGRQARVVAAIIATNLYGVDLMDEAVAACRLLLHERLEAVAPAGRGGLDVQTNIHCGNALVGYGSAPAARAALGGWPADAATLPALLDAALAREYGIDPGDSLAFGRWRASHQPLHWPAAFPAALARGGFDVVVGNPPYLAYNRARNPYLVRGYQTEGSGNLYALVVERALGLTRQGGRCGMILPVASVATGRMASLQALYGDYQQWHSHFAVRPARLFADVDMNLTISLVHKVRAGQRLVTGYRRWSSSSGERESLFSTLCYTSSPELPGQASRYAKLGSAREAGLLCLLHSHGRSLGDYVAADGVLLYYHSGGRYWRKALPQRLSSHYRPLRVAPAVLPIVFGLLNSQLFYWYWISHSNCMDLVAREVRSLPVFALETVDAAPFAALMVAILAAYTAGATTRLRHGRQIHGAEQNFAVGQAKPLLDALDTLLATAYGFNDEQRDFVLNYDLKYRLPTPHSR